MVGVKELCALLLAGSMGAGSVVAVQQARPAVSKKVKAQKPKLQRASVRRAPAPKLRDCPVAAAPLAAYPLADLAPIGPMPANALASLSTTPEALRRAAGTSLPLPPLVPGEELIPGPPLGPSSGSGGGGGSPVPPPELIPPDVGPRDPVATVPEPASWAMMVSGFGLIGLALRRGKANAGAV